MAYYTVGKYDDTKYNGIKEARASARKLLTKAKGRTEKIYIYKWKICVHKDHWYGCKTLYDEVCGIASKVTDPDGLVVYLFQEVRKIEERYDEYYQKGPARILKKDGSVPHIVSANTWTECREV